MPSWVSPNWCFCICVFPCSSLRLKFVKHPFVVLFMLWWTNTSPPKKKLWRTTLPPTNTATPKNPYSWKLLLEVPLVKFKWPSESKGLPFVDVFVYFTMISMTLSYPSYTRHYFQFICSSFYFYIYIYIWINQWFLLRPFLKDSFLELVY